MLSLKRSRKVEKKKKKFSGWSMCACTYLCMLVSMHMYNFLDVLTHDSYANSCSLIVLCAGELLASGADGKTIVYY